MRYAITLNIAPTIILVMHKEIFKSCQFSLSTAFSILVKSAKLLVELKKSRKLMPTLFYFTMN